MLGNDGDAAPQPGAGARESGSDAAPDPGRGEQPDALHADAGHLAGAPGADALAGHLAEPHLPDAPPAHDPVAQLRFLHELLRLATTAQTWDEPLETVVDGTRGALRAHGSSL